VIYIKTRVDWSGRHLTPAGSRGKVETPQALAPRRLDFLPAESKCLQRKGTVMVQSEKQEAIISPFLMILLIEPSFLS
jgi:hypothetical protein